MNTNNPDLTRTDIIINEVSYAGDSDWIELFNPTDETIDVSEYWLCLGPGAYSQISNLTIEGNTNLESSGYVVVSGYSLPNEAGGLGLYNTNSFTDSDAIVDFVQYGQGTSARVLVAEDATLWYEGQFLPTVSSASNTISYQGEGFGIEFWSETSTETPGAENVFD